MSTSYDPYKVLELILREVLSVIKPSQDDLLARWHVINEIQAAVESLECLRGAAVVPFGSFVSHLYSKWSDLDISVEIPNVGKRRKLELLKEIRRSLSRRGSVRKLQFIPNARIPLLIYERNYYRHNISCDISINNLAGQIKSKFFLWITGIDDRFHEMVLLVKEWAKIQEINDPKTGTLNSYSLSLLVIFHFQTCVPPILPPLMEIYAGNLVADFTGDRQNAERRIQDTCDANIRRFRSQSRQRVVNGSSLSELFVSFFEKFSRINSMASENVICPYTGRWELRRNSSNWMDKNYPLIIDDPLEKPDNSARAVSQLIKISDAFEVTHRRLISANHDRSSLIASLVRPQMRAKLLGRTSLENSSSWGRRDYGPPPSRADAVPPLSHDEIWIMPPEARPTTAAAQRTRQTFQSQGRMEWRQRH